MKSSKPWVSRSPVAEGSIIRANVNTLTVELAEPPADPDQPLVTLKGKGETEGVATVSAKLTLARYNLADRDPMFKAVDDQIVARLRAQYVLLSGALSRATVS